MPSTLSSAFASPFLAPSLFPTSNRKACRNHRRVTTCTVQPPLPPSTTALRKNLKVERRDVRTVPALGVRPLGFLARFLLWLYARNELLRAVYARISPAMPAALECHDLPSGAVPSDGVAVAQVFNYDEGHAGRFTVPTIADVGGSVSAAYVFGRPNVFEYTRSCLTFPYCESPQAQGEVQSDVTFFSPGLNTVHQPYEKELTAPARAAFYAAVLQVVPLAHVHLGTSFDQPDVAVPVDRSWLSALLRVSCALFPGTRLLPAIVASGSEEGRKKFVWDASGIDSIQTVLSALGLVDTPLKATYRALLRLACANGGNDGEPITLMAYSRASVELKAALEGYIVQRVKQDGMSKQAVEQRLRERVTVVTVGTPARGFPDGPKYVHIAARTDGLNCSMGVNEKRRRGAGADAVFLNCDSPYHEDAGDNHNFAAAPVQFVSIVLAYNGARTFAQLWELCREGKLKMPGNVSELTYALVTLSNGLDWLWKPASALQDVRPETFPDRATAAQLLSEALGEEYVERVERTFCVEEG